MEASRSRLVGSRSFRGLASGATAVVATALFLVLAPGAAAKVATFKGHSTDPDTQAKISFSYEWKIDNHQLYDHIEEIQVRNARYTCPGDVTGRHDYDFALLEPVRIDKDGEFSAKYASQYELYQFKGRFSTHRDGRPDLTRAEGTFKVTLSEGGLQYGCTTGRVDWKAVDVDAQQH
jgi:hypothetical protein